MLIRSVKLNNIRSYTSEVVNFPEGSTILSGDIGCGKSTVLLAVEFALFGLSKGAGNSLLRHGKQEGSVELNFVLDDNNIIIKRFLKRVGGDARQDAGFIIVNDVKKDCTPVELKSFIIDLLGYPKDSLTKKDLIYTYTVYTPQEEMKQILSDDPESRLEILRKVFGIDKYKRVRENCSFLLKDLKEKRARLEGQCLDLNIKKLEHEKFVEEKQLLELQIDKVNVSLDFVKKIVFGKKDNLRILENKVFRLNNIRKDVEHSNLYIKEKESLLINLKKDKLTLSDQLNLIKDKLVKIEIIPVPIKTEGELEREIVEKDGMINDLINKKSVLNEKLNNNSLNISVVNKRISDSAKVIEEVSSKGVIANNISEEIKHLKSVEEDIDKTLVLIQGLTTKIGEKNVHINSSKEIIDKIVSLDNCPTCLQEVANSHKSKVVDIENQKVNSHKEELLNISELRKEKEELLKKQKLQHADLLKKQNIFSRLDAEIKKLELDIKKFDDDRLLLHKLEDERKVLDNNLNVLNNTDVDKLKVIVVNFKRMLDLIRKNKILQAERDNLLRLLDEKKVGLQKLDLQEGSLVDSLEKKRSDVVELNNNILELGDVEDLYKKSVVDFESCLLDERKIELSIASLSSDLVNVVKRIDYLVKEISDKELALLSVKKIGEVQNWLDNYFIPLTSVIEKQVMAGVFWQFNDLFKQWFNQLMDDESISARIDDQFSPVIEQNGYDTKIDFLSGGEKTSAALAYRLALNKVINSLVGHIKTKSLIILDEPTDGFSNEQLDKVRYVLEQLEVKQLILVSHESKIESFVDNVIRINKEGHESRVVV